MDALQTGQSAVEPSYNLSTSQFNLSQLIPGASPTLAPPPLFHRHLELELAPISRSRMYPTLLQSPEAFSFEHRDSLRALNTYCTHKAVHAVTWH